MKKLIGIGFLVLLFYPCAYGKTLFGIDVLKKEKFRPLENAHVALITNHTGIDRRGTSTVDVLHESKNVNLQCILSPEHGFRGTAEHGEKVADALDNLTGVPIYSLYGVTQRPTDEMLQGVDTIVYDIQDIGTRFYTYITTMGMAMEEAEARGLRFVVLDRPNPIRGDIVEGDVLDADVRRFTGYFDIPVRYGLTPGELAKWIKGTKEMGLDLEIVPLRKWSRSDWYDQTGYSFIAPSPNIRSILAALLYTGIGCFEATNVSVGRGTNQPFEVFGAPWLDNLALCSFLRQQNFPGATFETVEFTPEADLYKGQTCQGIKILVTDRSKIRPFTIFLAAFSFIYQNHANDFKPEWEEVRVVTGSHKLKEFLESKMPLLQIVEFFKKSSQTFLENVQSYWLYP